MAEGDELTDPMHMQQGLTIPCVDCTMLHGHNPECPHCGGTGHHFYPARMCDFSIQWELGKEDRERCSEFRSTQEWDSLADSIRGCFVSYLIYGPGWASGYLNLRPDEEDESWDKWNPVAEEWKRIESDLKEEFFAATKKAGQS